MVEDNLERACFLARTYSLVYNSDNYTHSPEISTNAEPPLLIAPADVTMVLQHLISRKAPGLDGFHPLILHHLMSVLDAPLADIFNLSLTTGRIPMAWEEAVIKPFFKGGNKHIPNNYRPVSLTSVIGKAMERLMKHLLQKHIDENEIQSPHQHDFVTKRS